jgi:hypothetical protein
MKTFAKKKKPMAATTTWGHHDNMIVNLRDWVKREVDILRSDLDKETPHLAEDPHVLKLLKSAEDMNRQLFDLIRSIADRAEVETKKLKKFEPVEETTDDEEEIVEE